MSRFYRTVSNKRHWERILPLLFVLSIMVSACGPTLFTTSSSTSAPITVELFFHSGQGAERAALNATLQAFHDSHLDIQVEAVQQPEGSYIDQVNVAAMSDSLPCLLDFDGPTIYNYVWAVFLIPLDTYVSSQIRAAFLPSVLLQ